MRKHGVQAHHTATHQYDVLPRTSSSRWSSASGDAVSICGGTAGRWTCVSRAAACALLPRLRADCERGKPLSAAAVPRCRPRRRGPTIPP